MEYVPGPTCSIGMLLAGYQTDTPGRDMIDGGNVHVWHVIDGSDFPENRQ